MNQPASQPPCGRCALTLDRATDRVARAVVQVRKIAHLYHQADRHPGPTFLVCQEAACVAARKMIEHVPA